MNPLDRIFYHANVGGEVLLSAADCAAVADAWNAVVEAKNLTVRENHDLARRLLDLQNKEPR